MLSKIAEFFWRIAGWKTFLPALLVYLVFAGFVMRYGEQKIQEICGRKVEVLDKQLSYTPEKARAILTQYNDEGRAFAARFELIADTLYPLSYTFLFLIIMAWVFKSLSVYGIRIKYIHLLPLVVMAAAYNENACVITMLNSFPRFSDFLVRLSSFYTSLKWSLLAAETFIIGAAVWLLTFYRISRKKVIRN